MVKDSKSKKPAKPTAAEEAELPKRAQKAFVATGRPPGDPLDVRSERLVMRVHPDLLETLSDCASEAHMTRSLYVEQILLSYLNRVENAQLDRIGRRMPHDAPDQSERRRQPSEVGTAWTEVRTGLDRLRGGGQDVPRTSKSRR